MLFDVDSRRVRVRLPEASGGLAFSPDGSVLATGSIDGSVRLWDVASGTLRRRLVGHDRDAYGIAFSPNGKLLATSSDRGPIKIWSLENYEEVLSVGDDRVSYGRLAFSRDGRELVVVASRGRTIKLLALPGEM